MKSMNVIFISAALLLSMATANASLGTQKYYLKGDAATGTRIQSIAATSSVPFNKRYEDLSEHHKNLIKSKFNNLGLNDVPPFPKSGLKAVYKPVLKANKKFAHNQTLRIVVDVTSNGVVDKVVVENSDNQDLNSYLQRSLSQVAFEAAKCNGVACDMQFPIEISFN